MLYGKNIKNLFKDNKMMTSALLLTKKIKKLIIMIWKQSIFKRKLLLIIK